jgi:hypothetical protein
MMGSGKSFEITDACRDGRRVLAKFGYNIQVFDALGLISVSGLECYAISLNFKQY